MTSPAQLSRVNFVNIELARKFCRKIVSWVKLLRELKIKSHLDFGCGDGHFTHYMSLSLPEVNFLGYDASEDLVLKARRKYENDNLGFISYLNGDLFDSASCCFVIHETETREVLDSISGVLREKGLLMVLDYNMINIGVQEFNERFCCQRELQEIQRIGFEQAYRIHTAKGIDDFIDLAENSGFQTEGARAFSNGHFVWIGTKKDYGPIGNRTRTSTMPWSRHESIRL